MFCNQKIKIKGGMQAKAIFQSGTIFGEWLIYHVSFVQYIQTRQKRIQFYNICVAYCLIERTEMSSHRSS